MIACHFLATSLTLLRRPSQTRRWNFTPCDINGLNCLAVHLFLDPRAICAWRWVRQGSDGTLSSPHATLVIANISVVTRKWSFTLRTTNREPVPKLVQGSGFFHRFWTEPDGGSHRWSVSSCPLLQIFVSVIIFHLCVLHCSPLLPLRHIYFFGQRG